MDETTHISLLPGVGPALLTKLDRLGIHTIGDLLVHAPRRYADWTQITPIDRVPRFTNEPITVRATVTSCMNERSHKNRRMVITRADLADDSGTLQAMWFHQPFLARKLTEGRSFFFRGTVKSHPKTKLRLLISPIISDTAEIVPVYPETAGLTSRMLARLIDEALAHINYLSDPLPARVRSREQLLQRPQVLRSLHHPTSLVEAGQARMACAFEELYVFHAHWRTIRRELAKQTAPAIEIPEEKLHAFVSQLPFTLTDDQRRSAWRILQDLTRPVPMQRLLQGDVGSGKTIVGALATYAMIQAGYRVLWMAPTEILTNQHYFRLREFFTSLSFTVGLWTGNAKDSITSQVIVGTQAMLHAGFMPERVGLVIVDEQHRFGVIQRTLLQRSEAQSFIPHFLSMTATPIPRTLALALYGDLDVSVIRELPAGRQPITTQVIQSEERPLMYQTIREEIQSGAQAYIVCPLIDADRTADDLFGQRRRKSVTEEFQTVQKVFPDKRVGLLHGKLRPKEKQAVMAAFANRELDILVSTTVVEVGVDMPNASVMVIEGAEQFGLAQLHQLRGRVGRGNRASYCFLVSSDLETATRERLSLFQEHADGFTLAEADLRLRGPGELLGTNQSGIPEFRFASLFDYELIDRTSRAYDWAEAQGLHTPEQITTAHNHFE